MKRRLIVIVALLVGAAAPARAWCEATCLAPAHSDSATPHCPSHERSPDDPSIGGAAGAACPVIESARPVPSKYGPNFSITAVPPHPSTLAPLHPRPSAPPHLRTAGFFERRTPLRI